MEVKTTQTHLKQTKQYDLMSADMGTNGYSSLFGVSHYQLREPFGFDRCLPWSGKFPTETAPPTTKDLICTN